MNKKSRTIALGGILGALCVISLYAAVYSPVSRLAFYSLSSLFASFMVIESGIKGGWLFYAATSALAFLIIPDRVSLIPYLVFFGNYGVVKHYIESIGLLLPEVLLKGICVSVYGVVIYFLYTKVFDISFESKIPIYGLLALLIGVFYIYDFVYTKIIAYYTRRFKSY
ncbi:MAG: hypothetical protein GX352_01120 [Clostridiales bacterium]|nr:hypothetical protein [Clostridiales bacterium]